jgi:hypothetical protein
MALHRFFCVSLLLLISLPAQSDIIRVPADQPTIQAGIDAAAVGDQVLVAPGTYTGAGNKDLELRGRDIVVSSEAGAPMTIIDCEGSGRGFNLFPPLTSAARIEGFTIKSGDGDGGSNQGGGGMYVVACSPTIAECIFEENVANGFLTQGGGGALAIEFSSSLISGCRFVRNRVGPGVGSGGAVVAKNCSITIDDCDFESNLAEYFGFLGSTGGAIALTTLQGFAEDGPRGKTRITSSRFVGNDGGSGGAIGLVQDDPLDIADCVFLSNTARFGAALRCFNGLLTVSRCSFARNVDRDGAGCISSNGPVTIDNTIIAQNGPGPGLSAPCAQLTIRCTDMFGNEGGDWTDCLETRCRWVAAPVARRRCHPPRGGRSSTTPSADSRRGGEAQRMTATRAVRRHSPPLISTR